jgi:hypothetical protein
MRIGAEEPRRRERPSHQAIRQTTRAGDPGIEPGVAVLETAVLPIHQSPRRDPHSRPSDAVVVPSWGKNAGGGIRTPSGLYLATGS